MGYAAYRVFYESQNTSAKTITLYGTQLILNFIWTPIFFRYRRFGWALIDIIALWGTAAATAWEFSKVDSLAGRLLLPYLGWTGFASTVTWYVWAHNPSGGYRRINNESSPKRSESSPTRKSSKN